MTFRTRVSVFLVVFITVVVMFPIVAAIKETPLVPVVMTVCIYILIMVMLFGIRYRIEGSMLYVGFLFRKGDGYDLLKLESITPTRSIMSSPASSLRRIKLDFGCGKALVISPAAQDVFIDEILRINPNVKVNL